MAKAPNHRDISAPGISAWMNAQDGQSHNCFDLRRLQAGTQNLMIAFKRDSTRYVLRQPPAGSILPGAKIVTREMRVLTALEGSNVPHPAPFGASLGETLLGGPFYVMEAVDGFNAIEGLASDVQADAAFQHRMGLALVEGLVALSRVDVGAAGLHDFGDPHGFLARQVVRWRRQLDGYSDLGGWTPEGSFRNIDTVCAWLADHRPDRNCTGLIHGDFHVGNMLFHSDNGALAAIIDWELATIGDPLVDLGWLIATWPTSEGEDTGSGLSVPGATALPTTQALLEHYQAISGADVDDIGWFTVLACYKLGIIQEGSWARALAGQADRAIGAKQHNRAMAMVDKALRLIAEDQSEPRKGMIAGV